jgi:hypothetical protein
MKKTMGESRKQTAGNLFDLHCENNYLDSDRTPDAPMIRGRANIEVMFKKQFEQTRVFETHLVRIPNCRKPRIRRWHVHRHDCSWW